MNEWSIISKRHYHPGGAHHILYEWEDVIADNLGLSILDILNPKMLFWDKVFNKVGLNLLGMFRRNKVIAFRMSAMLKSDWSNSNKVIPWIVDFYIPKERFKDFFKATASCKVVLISSKVATMIKSMI